MSAEHAVAFFLFSVVAAVTPGPSNVLLTATGAQAGILRGLPCLLGVSAGMASMMFLAAFGLGAAVLAHASILTAIKLAGAAFLLWLAWRIATAPPGAAAPDARPTGFVGAAALQWVNPKAWLVSAGAVATYLQVDAAAPAAQSALFALVFVAAALPSGFAWLAFGAAIQRLMRSERAWRAFSVAMGAALAASVAMILL